MEPRGDRNQAEDIYMVIQNKENNVHRCYPPHNNLKKKNIKAYNIAVTLEFSKMLFKILCLQIEAFSVHLYTK